MDPIVQAIADNWFWSILGLLGIVWTIAASIESIARSAGRERSRREIAAYIAEGSMTADEGERLLSAGRSKRRSVC